MTPVTVVEGNRKLDPVSERNIAERRFSALASAVRVLGDVFWRRVCRLGTHRESSAFS